MIVGILIIAIMIACSILICYIETNDEIKPGDVFVNIHDINNDPFIDKNEKYKDIDTITVLETKEDNLGQLWIKFKYSFNDKEEILSETYFNLFNAGWKRVKRSKK